MPAAASTGASRIPRRPHPLGDIVDAIRAVASGGSAFEAGHLRAARQSEAAGLTARERAVLCGVVDGRTNDEMSADLGVSRKTIEKNLAQLFRRLGVESRTELAVRIEREGWLDVPEERAR